MDRQEHEKQQLDRTILDLLRQRPSRARVLEQAGLDYGERAGLTVAQACRELDLDPAVLLQALREHDAAERTPGSPSPPDWQTMPLSDLPGHLRSYYHDWFDGELPRLADLAARVRHLLPDHHDRLRDLEAALERFRGELESDMQREQEELFPALEEMASVGGQPDWPWGSVGSIIRLIADRHETTAEHLGTIRRLTGEYHVPPEPHPVYLVLVDGLRGLEQQFLDYLEVENEIVFPRVLKAEQRLSDLRHPSADSSPADDLD